MIKYIYENQENDLIQKDLADRFHLRGASITSILQGLEQKGFIERKIPANNERQKNIYVLPKAIELIEAFSDSFQKGGGRNCSSPDRRGEANFRGNVNQN